MKINSDPASCIPRKRIRKSFNRTPDLKGSGRRWNLITSSKMRFVLGVYIVLLTLSLYYGSQTVSYTVYDFHRSLSQRHSQEQQQPQFLANIVTWSMSDATKHALEDSLAELQWDDKDNVHNTKNFIQDAKDILLPYISNDDNLQRILGELVADGRRGTISTSIDAIVLENLPMDPYVPPTPTDESVKSLHKPTYVAEAVLLAIGELAGTYTVGYKSETEYSNPWAHEGFPRPGPGGSALTGTAGINHHQDMSYQGVIPDLLGLICLREGDDLDVQTTLLSIDNLIQRLPEHVVSILSQDRFKITASAEWVDIGAVGEDVVKTRAILDGTSLHLPVNWENMVGVDPEASQAIETLRQVLWDTKPLGVHLRDGVMVLFNNQKVVHGRTEYQNLKYDGSDRVVIRSYFVKRLNEAEMESRML